ncbi:MAG: GNAT family N-acetyltransferase [Clostridia bacterium]|nr:GNAT family N-acetyltransferase [Clostridia bacterium]
MIRLAAIGDANLIHKIMLSAYEEYRCADVPSSALNETVSSIEEALRKGSEKALLYFADGIPVGCVRFRTDKSSLYFFRLSVIPEARNRGIAKFMLAWLEDYAKEHGLTGIWCRVRMSVPKNIRLYQSVGFNVGKEEFVTNANGYLVKTVVMEKKI